MVYVVIVQNRFGHGDRHPYETTAPSEKAAKRNALKRFAEKVLGMRPAKFFGPRWKTRRNKRVKLPPLADSYNATIVEQS
jgi:hypothetical protein